jgi:paraquat-inducible protein B
VKIKPVDGKTGNKTEVKYSGAKLGNMSDISLPDMVCF